MAAFDKMTIWEAERRLQVLREFRNLLVQYYNNVSYVSFLRVEPNEEAIDARRQANSIFDAARESIYLSGYNVTIDYSDPPAIGGRHRVIHLLENAFNLTQYEIPPQMLIDQVEQAIGKYERNLRKAMLRTVNPFFWFNQALAAVLGFPFRLLASAGLVDESTLDRNPLLSVGRAVFVFAGTLITYVLAAVQVAEKLGYLQALRALIRRTF